jgi:hypothetical protein
MDGTLCYNAINDDFLKLLGVPEEEPCGSMSC